MKTSSCVLGLTLSIPALAEAMAGELADPVPVEAAGRPINVGHSGHAAPFFADFDGDGRKDLLVGENYEGRLLIFPNLGTSAKPRFGQFTVFQNGAPEGRIPSG